MEPDRLLTVMEAAEYLRVGRTKVYELVLRREIPTVRLGGAKGSAVRIPADALRRWVASQVEGAPAPTAARMSS